MRLIGSLLVLLLGLTPAMAQDSVEGRLREMLRRMTADLRAAQDSQAVLQATLDQEKQKNADLQKRIDDQTARAQSASAAASTQEVAHMQADLQTAQARAASLESSVRQVQDAYQQAVTVARAKDAEGRSASARAASAEHEAAACAAANTRLIAVANDILHLYQSQSFRSLLLGSYEPVLGLKKVELENTIQDYEDKILDQKYRPGQQAAKSPGAQ